MKFNKDKIKDKEMGFHILFLFYKNKKLKEINL